MRILSDELKPLINQTATIEGWLYKKRLLGGLNFLTVRDRRGLTQALIEDKNEIEKLRGLQVGTVLSLTGKVIEDARAPGGAELHDVKIDIITPVFDEPPIEIDKPIDHSNLDTLFENRVLNIRNINEQKIFKIRSLIIQYFREYLIEHEFIEIDTPKLLAGATEGGAEVFRVEYFDKTAVLAQSPQFYKQIMVGAYERVFEINHSYRAEPSATTRHLTELTMLDIEIGFVDSLQDVMDVVGDTVSYVLKKIYETNGDILKSLGAPDLKLADTIPVFTIAEIHDMYTKATGTDTTQEKDLTPDEERFICDHARKKLGSDLVFASEFPLEAMKFYHKADADKGVVYWADLLYRGIEIATCPLREHNYKKMIAQMTEKGLDVTSAGFKYYLDAFKYGLPPHGGCGLGIDRVVARTLNLANVKEATLFPRDIRRLTP